MILTGSPVIVSDTGRQRATTPRTGTVAPSAGETSCGPSGMAWVTPACPEVGPAHVEPTPTLAVDEPLEAGVVVCRVVLDVELRVLQPDGGGGASRRARRAVPSAGEA